jgi:RNA polymerase sigma-70 factor, ECF subfamily
MSLVYDDLRRLAASQLRRERSGISLQPTDLVHEVYLRMVRQKCLAVEGRAHFFGIASRAMRQILVDRARARHAHKRGGDLIRTTLTDAVAGRPDCALEIDVEALHEALLRLRKERPLLEQLVELRCFGGLSVEELAEALAISPATVKRRWSLARAWLYRELAGARDSI